MSYKQHIFLKSEETTMGRWSTPAIMQSDFLLGSSKVYLACIYASVMYTMSGYQYIHVHATMHPITRVFKRRMANADLQSCRPAVL